MLVFDKECCYFIISFLIFATFTKANNVYKEIYPALRDGESEFSTSHHYCDQRNTSHGTCPLFIGFLISFGGTYKSNGGLPGVQIALDEINRDPNMLPGYTLHYTLKDSNVSKGCCCMFLVLKVNIHLD